MRDPVWVDNIIYLAITLHDPQDEPSIRMKKATLRRFGRFLSQHKRWTLQNETEDWIVSRILNHNMGDAWAKRNNSKVHHNITEVSETSGIEYRAEAYSKQFKH